MTNLTTENVENFIEDSMMNFSAHVLLNRAIPDIRDGLKPVHRRILYTMYRQKATNFTKSAHVSGEVMKIHPSGDSYGSMVGLVQKDRNINPFLIGKGNFGMYTSRELQAAASRYSEVKLSDLAIDMMRDFDKNIVNFVDNYDGTIKMPEVLPVKYPSILTIAQSGIGVGFSSSTASFNMNEVIDATIKYIKTGKNTILVPDFATGGSIINDKEMFEQINKTGRGSVRLRGKAEIVGNEILITEVPYTTTREEIIDKIISLSKAKKLNEVTDIKDLTGLKGMLISVTARRNTNMQELLEKLFRFTPLQSNHSSNMNILINDLPRVMGVHEVISEWTKWRRSCIARSLVYDVKQMKEKLHLLKGLEKVLIDIDEAIEIIRRSPENQIETSLMSKFIIDEIQAKEVSNMKLRNINEDYIIKKIKDIKNLEKTIKEYEDTIGNDSKLDELVIKGLEESSTKFGSKRRTKIIELSNAPKVKLVEEIPDYPVTVHLTKEGYLYKFKGDQKPTLKPGDEVIKIFETTNKSEVLVFGSDVTCHKVELKDLEDTRVNQLGHYIINFIRDKQLEIVNYSILDDKYKYLIMVYSNNRVSKVNLKSFLGSRKILKNAFNKNQELVEMITLEKEANIELITDKTKVKVNTSKLTETNSRGATGVYMTRKGITQEVKVAN